MIAESDIHAVTGVLKLYFRELPEPLFTDLQYKHFISTLGKKNLGFLLDIVVVIPLYKMFGAGNSDIEMY